MQIGINISVKGAQTSGLSSPPVNTVAPVISGSTPVGSTLTTTNGTWTNSPTFAYQWYRGATLITSATATTYVTVTADTGLAVTCQVTGTNAAGSAIGISNAITPTAVVTPFAFTANTNNTSAGSSTATQFKLPLTTSTGLNIVVSWGDATTSTITNHLDAAVTHTYASAGTYSISITGTLPGWQFNNVGDRLKILNISSYGVLNITTNSIFRGCTNLISNATDAPTITTADLSLTFRSCTNFNGNIGSWNVSAVTNMTSMFEGASAFNNGGSSSIGTWNTSSVTTMSSMFNSCSTFNQPLSFNTGAVTSMSSMFSNATNFNGTLTFTSTAAVTTMQSMFQQCTVFNQPLSFNTGAVTNMTNMFFIANAFNNGGSSSIGSWNTSAVTNMSGVFYFAFAFNQPLSWNTGAVTSMSNMFNYAQAFNQPLSFNTALVTNMSGMFGNTLVFNQPLTFNTAAVTDMNNMFVSATAFNQPLSWNTGAVTNMNAMFQGATAFQQNIGSWNVANVTNFLNFMSTKTPATFSTANLDAIYNGWSASGVKPNINISFGGLTTGAKYSAAGAAGRAVLVAAPNNWTILDGGL